MYIVDESKSMLEFKHKRKIKKRIYSKFTIVVLSLIVLALFNGVWGIYQKVRTSKQKLDLSKEKYEEVKDRHLAIEEQIHHLNTNSGVEEEVRTKFNMAKEGERVIVLVDENDDSQDGTLNDSKRSFWSKIFFWKN